LEKANEQLKQEIIERERAAEALKESEENYRSLFESNQDGIAFSDMEGNFVDANQAYLNMLGYTMVEYRKLDYPQLTPKKWHKQDEEIVKNQVLPRGYSDVFEKEFIRKDGTIIAVSVRAFLIQDKKRNPTGMWGIIRDITARKQAEVELEKHQERLEELVEERTAELKKTINLMADRELRMAELKETIKKLRSQLESAGLSPIADDPLKEKA
jgi:PAS domain S-box-containing protein